VELLYSFLTLRGRNCVASRTVRNTRLHVYAPDGCYFRIATHRLTMARLHRTRRSPAISHRKTIRSHQSRLDKTCMRRSCNSRQANVETIVIELGLQKPITHRRSRQRPDHTSATELGLTLNRTKDRQTHQCTFSIVVTLTIKNSQS
jgi:hypothetical protein